MPHRRLLARMAEAAALEESAESIEQLSIAEREQSGGSDPSVTALEEEQYVQSCMDKAVTIYGAINCGEGTPEQWATLETELAIEIEYTSWPLVSDELIRNLVELLVDIVDSVGRLSSEGAACPEAYDCAFSVVDVLEGLMYSRFIVNEGDELERPFDQDSSLAVYRALVGCLKVVVDVLGQEQALAAGRVDPKAFSMQDDKGAETVFTKSRSYDPIVYLQVLLTLLSHTAVQTDVTCFWWKPDTVIEQIWAADHLKALLMAIERALDKLAKSTVQKDRDTLTSLIDRWTHTVHGIICTDSIGRQIAVEVPEEDAVPEEGVEKPSIEALTCVSTYLGRWMDVRCLPCTCHFCGVQKAALDAMLESWDKRLAHRLIELGGVATVGRVSNWMLTNFRKQEAIADLHGEDLYRTCVALNTQIVHLCVLSDYDCAHLADETTFRGRAVWQAMDSGFLNCLLGYFIPRKLCRLEDRRFETTEDANRARRLARVSCKSAIEFLLLSADGWITDTCYNAKESVRIEPQINSRMAPAAERLVELWHEAKEQCRAVDELLDHYSPFFLKLCEIIRLSARYGQMKDLWSQELLNGAVDVLANFAWLKLQQHTEGDLPAKKALLCAMATFCDMCHPSFGHKDHFHGASRAVHDISSVRTLLEVAKTSRAATSCIRALSYVTRVELVLSLSLKNATRPEQTKVLVCSQCHRPPTSDRPLRQCSRCKHAYYCSTDCQRLNWKEHERECSSLPEESAKKQRLSDGPAAAAAGCAQCESLSAKEGAKKLMKCGRCREVFYCSRDCQAKHWDRHQLNCLTEEKDPVST